MNISDFFDRVFNPRKFSYRRSRDLSEANDLLAKEIDRRQAVEADLLDKSAALSKQAKDLKESQEVLIKKNDELKKLNDYMVDRETKMVQLKKENEELRAAKK